jgi:hypothetical protein
MPLLVETSLGLVTGCSVVQAANQLAEVYQILVGQRRMVSASTPGMYSSTCRLNSSRPKVLGAAGNPSAARCSSNASTAGVAGVTGLRTVAPIRTTAGATMPPFNTSSAGSFMCWFLVGPVLPLTGTFASVSESLVRPQLTPERICKAEQ